MFHSGLADLKYEYFKMCNPIDKQGMIQLGMSLMPLSHLQE